jgi:hypothetical protein
VTCVSVCAVTTVVATTTDTPNAVNVVTSRVIPAPPLESELPIRGRRLAPDSCHLLGTKQAGARNLIVAQQVDQCLSGYVRQRTELPVM